MTDHSTAQEAFWAGEFGDVYTERNDGTDWIAANTAMFARVLQRAPGIESVLEIGANRGLNLRALSTLLPKASLSALEINARAVAYLQQNTAAEVIHESILEFAPARTWNLVLTKGVLIHLAPERLPQVYDTLHAVSDRYICIAEYYNPDPVSIPYRGHADRLFKRDFAGDMLERFPGLQLVDYGFVYRRDSRFPQDDLTWFLLEKMAGG